MEKKLAEKNEEKKNVHAHTDTSTTKKEKKTKQNQIETTQQTGRCGAHKNSKMYRDGERERATSSTLIGFEFLMVMHTITHNTDSRTINN